MSNNRETKPANMATSKIHPPSSWEAKLQRRREFCQRFVAEHHPGMVDVHKIKVAHA